jgi:hypothetical protein
MDLPSYYSNIKPSLELLKERLKQIDRAKLEQIVNQKAAVKGIDSNFIKDATEFLRLSILNLMAYKLLMSGFFLAWGKVTLYYSNFYAINCLLRLKGFALVHIYYVEEKPLTFKVVRQKDKNEYILSHWKGGNTHQYLWNKFCEYYPDLFTKELAKFTIDERERWNYDLSLPSRSMDAIALDDARDRWENNFIDPDYGKCSTEEAAEYYHDLMANTGYEEAGSWDLIRECTKNLKQIALSSKYKNWYTAFLEEVRSGITDFGSSPEMKREIQKYLSETIKDIK